MGDLPKFLGLCLNCRAVRFMFLDFCYPIFIVNKDNDRVKFPQFGRLNRSLCNDDHLVAGLVMSGWGQMEADAATALLSCHYIPLPSLAIGDIGNVHHLKEPYAA